MTHAQVQDSFVNLNKRHLRANVSSLSFSIFLNRANRYFLASGRDWADISFDRWKQNLSQWPEWDWDLYTTNWFAHPLQGAIYYNTARSLKLGYLESMGYAFLGTSIWEYLGEDLPPSYNDFFTTFLGGIHMGEVLFRLSENILDDRSYGRKRFSKELLASMVNPGGGLSRLMYGQMNDHYLFPNHYRSPLRSKLTVSGIYMLSTSKESFQSLIPNLMYSVDYGSISKSRVNYSPFDLFWFKAWLRFDKFDQDAKRAQIPIPYFNLKSSAVIHGKTVGLNKSKTEIIALFQDYDYFKTYTYDLSSIAFTVGFVQLLESKELVLTNRFQFGGIAMSAIRSEAIDFVRPDDQGDERDYTMGSGYLFKINSRLDFKQYGRIDLVYDYWKTYVHSGPSGTEDIYQFSIEYSIPVSNRYSFSIAFSHYNRRGDYRHEMIDNPYKDHNTEISSSVVYLF